eukprot:6207694-Pleurochrysis_carterae.AAC.6
MRMEKNSCTRTREDSTARPMYASSRARTHAQAHRRMHAHVYMLRRRCNCSQPCSPQISFLDACASVGLRVLLPISNYFLDNPGHVKSIVYRVATHPAVLMWAVSNEPAGVTATSAPHIDGDWLVVVMMVLALWR